MKFFSAFNKTLSRIIGHVSPFHVVMPQQKQTPTKAEIFSRFKKIVNDAVWEELRSLTPLSFHVFFEANYLILRTLLHKKDLNKLGLMDIAFLTGNAAIINFALQRTGLALTERLQEQAVVCGNISSIEALEQLGLAVDLKTLEYAAWQGQVEVVRFCWVNRNLRTDEKLLDWAAVGGDVPTLRYLIEECGLRPDMSTVESAIHGSRTQASVYLFGALNVESQAASQQNSLGYR